MWVIVSPDKGGKTDRQFPPDKGGKTDRQFPPDKGGKTDRQFPPDKGSKDGRFPPDKGGKTDRQFPPDKGGKTDRQFPPDKGGKGGYIPYNKTLTEKARKNRKNPTPAEQKLWYEVLQSKRLDNLKFTRQKPLDEYIVDFYCAKLMLAIEIDGDNHAGQKQHDKDRTKDLNKFGVEVIRYTNAEVLNNLEGVYQDLHKRISARKPLNPA